MSTSLSVYTWTLFYISGHRIVAWKNGMWLHPPMPWNHLLFSHCRQVRGVGMSRWRLSEDDLCSFSMDGGRRTRELRCSGFGNGNHILFSGGCFDEDQERRRQKRRRTVVQHLQRVVQYHLGAIDSTVLVTTKAVSDTCRPKKRRSTTRHNNRLECKMFGPYSIWAPIRFTLQKSFKLDLKWLEVCFITFTRIFCRTTRSGNKKYWSLRRSEYVQRWKF